MEFYHTCMDTSLGQAKGFGDSDFIFKVTGSLRLLNLLLQCWRDNFLYAQYLMTQWFEFHQTCMDVSLRQVEELIRFW